MTTRHKQATPRLRFKGFDGEWEEKRLGEIGDFFAGGDIKKEKLTPFGRYPVLANALTNSGIVGFYDDYEFESPAITITGRGDVGVAKARKENFSAVVRLLVLKNKPNYDVDFLENAFNKINFNVESTGVPQLTVPQCKSYSIYSPSHEEQTQLGHFFRQLDHRIAQSRALWEKSRQLKKAMLAKMFPAAGETTPKIRFKGFTGEWERKTLGEIAFSYSGGTPSVGNNKFYGGNIPFIRSGEIHGSKTELFLTQSGLENSSAKLVKKGDILYALYGATSGEVGRSQINGAINQAILAIIPSENYDAEFISQWLKANKENIVNLYLQGGQGNLSGEIVKKIEISFPTKTEQTAIGNFFRQLDDTIALHAAETEKLGRLKKALLAAMLV